MAKDISGADGLEKRMCVYLPFFCIQLFLYISVPIPKFQLDYTALLQDDGPCPHLEPRRKQPDPFLALQTTQKIDSHLPPNLTKQNTRRRDTAETLGTDFFGARRPTSSVFSTSR
ncbi:hypothetical protein K505DRAFT_12614 [Melanomma pulvis-pyrius CBS 109.77]|uniref:Uncharacterized protein n=1 Tax=Melanomma pulvis-pyrius CBS 109.77 TaxID=1314802 RepID=A0A6A6WN71_9PLEO|nr:hypothetical protein K505DRAFT_12614 [Melanomma pulvis-pyrius CBS 109.77]